MYKIRDKMHNETICTSRDKQYNVNIVHLLRDGHLLYFICLLNDTRLNAL